MTINRCARVGLFAACVAALVALINGPAPAAPIAEEVSFTHDIRPVIENYCATCHAGVEPEGGFALDSYKAVRAQVETGALLERINDPKDPMPPAGLLPIQHRRLFKKWADGGYVNTGTRKPARRAAPTAAFKPPAIVPVDVSKEGFRFLAKMQGHWVGALWLMGQNYGWFAFDYRAIAPSHVHGIFEGGTMGNLFTSFFVTRFNGTRTIMARNGGILNGIYRTSYLVLDRVENVASEERYRFVDAYGGKRIMSIDVAFFGSSVRMESHTSRMGIREPTLHMRFEGRRRPSELATEAAKAVGFPKNVVDRDFAKGLPRPDWGPKHTVTSASYMWQEKGKTLVELARLAKDPYRIDQMPHVAKLHVKVKRDAATRGKKLLILLSERALVDKRGMFKTENGYLQADLANTILLFPEISGKQDEFTLTYLHPGTYYLTVVADVDGDSFPTPGDVTHPVRKVVVKPRSSESVVINDLTVGN